jgi:hypothetical protein
VAGIAGLRGHGDRARIGRAPAQVVGRAGGDRDRAAQTGRQRVAARQDVQSGRIGRKALAPGALRGHAELIEQERLGNQHRHREARERAHVRRRSARAGRYHDQLPARRIARAQGGFAYVRDTHAAPREMVNHDLVGGVWSPGSADEQHVLG